MLKGEAFKYFGSWWCLESKKSFPIFSLLKYYRELCNA